MAASFSSTVYAYPFDIVGDPLASARIADLCVGSVTLAAAYHSVRAATPRHPAHRVIDASHAAVYTPVRGSAWAGRRLSPVEPGGWAPTDSFGLARDALHSSGIRVRAWIALLHSSHLGRRAPELCVSNAFGDRYDYALCPSSAEVRDYAATLAYEVTAAAGVDAAVIEACGPLGFSHQSHHDKTGGADWSADEEALLSICFCAACTQGYREHGVDPSSAANRVRAAVGGSRSCAEPSAVLGADADAILAVRHAASERLFREVVVATRGAGITSLTMHLSANPWSTGPASAVVPGVDGLDAAVAHCWSLGRESIQSATRLSRIIGPAVRLGAYCTVLAPTPADPAAHLAQWNALVAAGVRELHLYHVGLASDARLRVLAEALAELGPVAALAETPESTTSTCTSNASHRTEGEQL